MQHLEGYAPATKPATFSAPRAFPNMEMRLIANSVLDPVTGCWNWTGARRTDRPGCEYGKITIYVEGRRMKAIAHRVSYQEFRGPIPDGLEVDHTCTNPSCINPAHLQLATRSEQETFKRRRARG